MQGLNTIVLDSHTMSWSIVLQPKLQISSLPGVSMLLLVEVRFGSFCN